MQPHVGNIFSDDQALTANAASANIIDLGAADYGEGNPVDVVVEFPVASSGGTTPTYTIALQESVDEAFSSPIVVLQTKAYSQAEAKPGERPLIKFGLPTPIKRYVRMYYTVTGSPTGGKVNAWLARRDM